MTTIIRIGSTVVTDSKWVTHEDEIVVSSYNKPKAMLHPSGKCLVAYSGKITTTKQFVALDNFVKHVIDNLAVIKEPETITAEMLNDLIDLWGTEGFRFMLFFKHLTVSFHLGEGNNHIIEIDPENEVITAGSSGLLARDCLTTTRSLNSTLQSISKNDSVSGGPFYRFDLEELTE